MRRVVNSSHVVTRTVRCDRGIIYRSHFRVPHVGQDMLTPFGELMISPIHDIYIAEFVSRMTMLMD